MMERSRDWMDHTEKELGTLACALETVPGVSRESPKGKSCKK